MRIKQRHNQVQIYKRPSDSSSQTHQTHTPADIVDRLGSENVTVSYRDNRHQLYLHEW